MSVCNSVGDDQKYLLILCASFFDSIENRLDPVVGLYFKTAMTAWKRNSLTVNDFPVFGPRNFRLFSARKSL
jgi:hypothetical protein